ncbi:hypothetical protein EB796_006756 [Bugula neritina]|uniref:Uncharacterized protein n=1 Tax=Bugula neritina TaxID=10212 RepID=A0A7J7K8G3_BUGNE|nr:hypothetical protein EB796_006756 [Bugula neritina]
MKREVIKTMTKCTMLTVMMKICLQFQEILQIPTEEDLQKLTGKDVMVKECEENCFRRFQRNGQKLGQHMTFVLIQAVTAEAEL